MGTWLQEMYLVCALGGASAYHIFCPFFHLYIVRVITVKWFGHVDEKQEMNREFWLESKKDIGG